LAPDTAASNSSSVRASWLGLKLAAAQIDACRRQSPDQAEDKKEMAPVVGVDNEAFDGFADERGIAGDQ